MLEGEESIGKLRRTKGGPTPNHRHHSPWLEGKRMESQDMDQKSGERGHTFGNRDGTTGDEEVQRKKGRHRRASQAASNRVVILVHDAPPYTPFSGI